MADRATPPAAQPSPRPVAVALDWTPGTETAPAVVAAGRGFVAEEILALAFAHGVKVREDADLAEMLAAIDVGAGIPLEAFAAVAEILVYVYRANGELPPPAPQAAPDGAADGAAADNG